MILVTLIVFLIVLTVLVVAHEYGHYLFARLFKMKVEEFCILGLPFGKRVHLATTRDGVAITTYPLAPLGGFVRIRGMVPQEDGSEVYIPGGFYSRPPWQRWIVLFAGPVFSIAAGIAALIPLFMATGIQKPLDEPYLGSVAPDGPAYRAGLRPGDKILAVNGHPVHSFYEIVAIVRDLPGRSVAFTYERNGESSTVEVLTLAETAPVLDRKFEPTGEVREQGKIGASPRFRRVPVGLVQASKEAVLLPYKMLSGLFSAAQKPKELKDQVGGPIAIFGMVGASVQQGFDSIIAFACLLSISLGIFNLLPFPPFDGGQMLVAFAEMLRGGKRLSYRIQSWVFGVGYVLVGLLIVTVFANDIGRLLPR